MTKNRTFYNITLFFTISVALALTAMRTVALLADFDVIEGYYAHGSFLAGCFSWGALIVSVIVFTVSFLLRRSLSNVEPRADSGVIIFTSALFAFMIIAVFISDIFTISGSLSIPEIMTLAFSVPAALYPLIGMALPIRSQKGKILLGAFLLLWLFSVTLNIYFTDDMSINNPNRSLLLAVIAVVLLFFVYECRYTISQQKPWCYIGFGFVTVILGGMYTLPNIILVLMKVYPDKLNVTFEFILAVIWLYALLRLCTYSYDVFDPEEDNGEADTDEDVKVKVKEKAKASVQVEDNDEYIDDVIKEHNREVARERRGADENGLTVEFKKINDRLD